MTNDTRTKYATELVVGDQLTNTDGPIREIREVTLGCNTVLVAFYGEEGLSSFRSTDTVAVIDHSIKNMWAEFEAAAEALVAAEERRYCTRPEDEDAQEVHDAYEAALARHEAAMLALDTVDEQVIEP
ncbi:MAG TPA: hypothetical protein PLB92_05915 [Rhodoglobus sp.]|nr:hypothetical protein [Rhodoglobus sp.]